MSELKVADIEFLRDGLCFAGKSVSYRLIATACVHRPRTLHHMLFYPAAILFVPFMIKVFVSEQWSFSAVCLTLSAACCTLGAICRSRHRVLAVATSGMGVAVSATWDEDEALKAVAYINVGKELWLSTEGKAPQ